jgi:hypothetical protein
MKAGDRRYVSIPQLFEVLDSLGFNSSVQITRSGQAVTMDLQELKALCYEAIENGHLDGGRIEVAIPGRTQKLVGDPDGEFWLGTLSEQ